MSSIEDRVLNSFFKRITDDETVGSALSDELRAALWGTKLPKPDQIVQLIVDRSGDALA